MFCRDCRLLVSYGEVDGLTKMSGSFGPVFFTLPLHVPAMYPHRQQNYKTCVFGYQDNQNNEKKLVHII